MQCVGEVCVARWRASWPRRALAVRWCVYVKQQKLGSCLVERAVEAGVGAAATGPG